LILAFFLLGELEPSSKAIGKAEEEAAAASPPAGTSWVLVLMLFSIILNKTKRGLA
jgi:hypothetical protein